MHRPTSNGFTLIELLVVLVIIGVLAAVAAPKFTDTKQRALRSSGMADMRNLAAGQAGFFADSSRYASTADTGTTTGRMNFTPSKGNRALVLVASTSGWSGVMTIPGDERCGIFSGTAARPAGMPSITQPGEPTCW